MKIRIEEIKRDIKGITNGFLLKLINESDCYHYTRKAIWYAKQNKPWKEWEIFRWRLDKRFIDEGWKYYGTYIDETKIVIELNEIKL